MGGSYCAAFGRGGHRCNLNEVFEQMKIDEQHEKTAHDIIHNWAADQGFLDVGAELQVLIDEIAEALQLAADSPHADDQG